MNKVRSAEEFLKSLEDPNTTRDAMVDRIDSEIVSVMSKYSDLLSQVKDKAGVDTKDLVVCSLIIGYLLKTHIDRYDLEQSLKG